MTMNINNKPCSILIFAACVIFSACNSVANQPQPQSSAPQNKIALEDCRIPGLNTMARCGSYEVYEDRAAQKGRKISLRIVVVPALSATPAPDPAFWLHGGPGAAATQAIPNVQGGFLAGVHQTRDIIFVDQRGTGKSNPLNCDIGDDPNDLQKFFGPLFPSDEIRACHERLEKIANLKLYTTPIAMDDLDEVRSAMGYNQINLIAASYGTIAAQVYMRQHPEHLRSVFLLGVAAPGFKQPLPFAQGAQHSLDLLVKDCDADPGCKSAFPRFHEEFDAVLARFNHGSIEAAVTGPKDKKKQTIRIFRANFVEHLRLMLYTTNSASLLPFIIHRAYENDYLPFEAASITFNTGGILSRGMYFTVTCSEGVPFITGQEVATDTQNTFVGPGRVEAHIAACKEWVRGEVPQGYTNFVNSDVPVLLVEGEVDAASPPWFADAIVKHFSHGREVKIRYTGHQFAGCIPDLLAKFIEKGSADGLDTSCTEAIRRPPFATRLPSNIAD